MIKLTTTLAAAVIVLTPVLARAHSQQQFAGYRPLAQAASVADEDQAAVAQRLARLPGGRPESEAECSSLHYTVTALRSDIASRLPGRERVLASMAGGVGIFGRDGKLLARRSFNSPCSGSKTQLHDVSVGQLVADDDLEIVVTHSWGGRNIGSEYLEILKYGGGQLLPIFEAKVFTWDDGAMGTGGVTRQGALRRDGDGSLLYQPPGDLRTWRYRFLAEASAFRRMDGQITKASGVRLRLAPRAMAAELTSLPLGSVLQVVERSAGVERIGDAEAPWYRVRTAGGKEGWVFGALTVPFEPASQEETWLAISAPRSTADLTFEELADLTSFLDTVSGSSLSPAARAEIGRRHRGALQGAAERIRTRAPEAPHQRRWLREQARSLTWDEAASRWTVPPAR